MAEFGTRKKIPSLSDSNRAALLALERLSVRLPSLAILAGKVLGQESQFHSFDVRHRSKIVDTCARKLTV